MPSKATPEVKATSPRSERARARPREILAAARVLFAEKGFEATRMDEVAAAVGVTKPAVYRYFPGKDRLIEALLEEDLAVPARMVFTWMDSYDGPIADLIEGFSRRAISIQNNGLTRGYLLLALDEAGRRPEMAEFMRREILAPGLVAISKTFQRAMDRGELAAGHDPLFVARYFFAPFLQSSLGAVGYVLSVGDEAERERYRQFHVAAFLKAFAP